MKGKFSEKLLTFTQTHINCSIRNYHDRQDLFQSVLISYIEIAKRYKGIGSAEFIKIARTCCRNKVRDYIRHRVVREKFLEHGEADRAHEDNTKQIVHARAILDWIGTKVSKRTQMVLSMARSGLNIVEIKKLSGISRTSYYRALREAKDAIHIEKLKIDVRARVVRAYKKAKLSQGRGQGRGTELLLYKDTDGFIGTVICEESRISFSLRNEQTGVLQKGLCTV